MNQNKVLTRRASLKTLAMVAVGFTLPSTLQAKVRKLEKKVRFGVITDVHIGFIKVAE